MDVAQYIILCFVATYVNVSYRKRTVTTFSTSGKIFCEFIFLKQNAHPLPKIYFWFTQTYQQKPNVCHPRCVRHFLRSNYYVNIDLDLATHTNCTVFNKFQIKHMDQKRTTSTQSLVNGKARYWVFIMFMNV